MALDSYDGLVAEIASHLDRNDLAANIPTFIRLAEDRMFAELRIRETLARAQATLQASEAGRYLSLPVRYASMKAMRLLTTPRITKIEQVNLDKMDEVRRECSGRPTFFAVHEEIEFDVWPDQAYAVEMVYHAKPQPLSGDNQSNEILAAYPSLYLYGSLVHSAPFLVHDERIQIWDGLYSSMRDAINDAARKAEYPGPLTARVYGCMP
jgi:hypothetical protein